MKIFGREIKISGGGDYRKGENSLVSPPFGVVEGRVCTNKSKKMSDKMKATARGLKHTLETIMSKMGNKKRKVTMQMSIDQYLAPGLKDSLFGKLTEDLMFNILRCLSRNYV